MTKLYEMHQKLMQTNRPTQDTSKISVISESEKILEDSNKSQQDDERYEQLPEFCRYLPDDWKKALLSLNTLHNTPADFGVTALLGYTNSCCQHLYNVESYKYGIKPISLYVMIILGTGGSKSTIHNELKGPIVNHESHMQQALENETIRYAMEKEIYDTNLEKVLQDRKNGLNTPFPKRPAFPETAFYIQEKFTVSGLLQILKSQTHVNIITAEAGVFFSSHAFQNSKEDSNRSTEILTMLTKLWDGDEYSKNIKDEHIILKNRRTNCVFMVQGHVIKDVLNNKMFQEQGFTHRILIAQIPTFEKPDMSFDEQVLKCEQQARQELQPFFLRLQRIIDQRPQLIPDRDYELAPPVIESTLDAKLVLAEFYNQSKQLIKPNQKLELYEGFASRLHEHCIRIAATIAVYNGHLQIELRDAQAAIDLMNMFVDHRYNLELGVRDLRPELTQGAKVLERWMRNNKNEVLTVRDLQQKGPNSLRDISSDQHKDILAELIKKEFVYSEEFKAKNGRMVTRYGYKDQDGPNQ